MCSIFHRNFFSSNFTFFKKSFLGIFDFWLKTHHNYKKLFKKRPKPLICLIIFYLKKKHVHFLTLTFFLGPLTWTRPFIDR